MKIEIDLRVDYAFKKVLSKPGSVMLRELVRGILGHRFGTTIDELTVVNPFQEKQTSLGKLSIVDLKVRDGFGRTAILEMQMFTHSFLSKRWCWYWSENYHSQITEGESYGKLNPVFLICFLNGSLFPHLSEYRLEFGLLERNHRVPFGDDLSIHLLELTKFSRKVEELESPLDQFLYLLRHAQELDTDKWPATLCSPGILEVKEELIMIQQNAAEREAYLSRMMAMLDEKSREEERQETEEKYRVIQEAMEKQTAALLDAQKDLQQKDNALQQKDNALQQKDNALQQKDNALQQKQQEADRLRSLGPIVGTIRTFESLLGRKQTSEEQLLGMSPEALQEMADNLKQEYLAAASLPKSAS
jgi:predicted transposase/invertase (TIGR01784 family)